MKKMYETPSVEKIEFMYRDQVVVASGNPTGGACTQHYTGNEDLSNNSCSPTHWTSDNTGTF